MSIWQAQTTAKNLKVIAVSSISLPKQMAQSLSVSSREPVKLSFTVKPRAVEEAKALTVKASTLGQGQRENRVYFKFTHVQRSSSH